MNAVQRSVFGGEKPTNDTEEPVDERLKGIEPKMIELVMNEVCLCKKKIMLSGLSHKTFESFVLNL
jgi:hypothetical protein